MSVAARFAALCLALSGCAEVLDIPDRPELSLDGPWGCLLAPLERPLPLSESASVLVQACDFVTNCATPVTGLSARLCARDDVECTRPLATGLVDQGGLFSLQVPTAGEGFDGYLEVSTATAACTSAAFGDAAPAVCDLVPECEPDAPDERCQVPIYARSLLFFNPPVTRDSVSPEPLPLLAAAAMPNLMDTLGAILDPTTGNLFVRTVDCEGAPAAGVSYRLEADQDVVTPLYMRAGVASEASPDTDQSGMGGFIGVPPGFAEVEAFNQSQERVGAIAVQAAPFTVTYSSLAPQSGSPAL